MILDRSQSAKRYSESGQGLVEYALILTLVALVVIIALSFLGPSIGNVFSQVVDELNMLGVGNNDVVMITSAIYDSGSQTLHIHATSDGVYNPSVTLTASPGGVMVQAGTHYQLIYSLVGCPCAVTVTSSEGGSATVTVGP
jgi:pilus assembly protein Flp/PilA